MTLINAPLCMLAAEDPLIGGIGATDQGVTLQRSYPKHRNRLAALFGIAMAPALAPAFIAVVDGAEVHAPSASQGLVMANSLCSSCHLVADRPGSVAIEGIPSFVSIANRPGQTRERIIAKLIQPHAPMPAVPLTTDNMLDIIAYLETLRTNNANPPLIEPGRPKLPEKLPAPS